MLPHGDARDTLRRRIASVSKIGNERLRRSLRCARKRVSTVRRTRCARTIVGLQRGSIMSEIVVNSHVDAITKDRLTEDWVSVAIGVLVFALSLFGLSGIDLLGWAVTTSIYTDLAQALKPFVPGFAGLGGGASLLAT